MTDNRIQKRREGVFGIAVLLAGLAITSLCLMPVLLWDTTPQIFMPTMSEEHLFFNVFGVVCGCWLLSWVSAVNEWNMSARIGQWVGILLLCAEEAMLVAVLRDMFSPGAVAGTWIAPVVVQTYLMGCFFGFFTLPSLTIINRRLTGLGTLVLLLPWLFGRDAVMSGIEYLHGVVF